MNKMKMTLAACAVVVAGFCSAEEQVAVAAKAEACACKCPCATNRCARPKPVSLTLCKDVKTADVDAFKKALLAKVDEMVAKARATEQTDERPPVRLMLVVDDGRRGPPPGGRGCGQRQGPQGCPPPPLNAPCGNPPPPPPAE